MRARRTISSFLLAVYLFSICGYAAVVLSCRCQHSHRHTHRTGAVCMHCRHCPETPADGRFHLHDAASGCSCKHGHSTEISLYDTDKHAGTTFVPRAADCTILLFGTAGTAPAVRTVRLSDRLKIPLPDAPALLAGAMRAPPALA